MIAALIDFFIFGVVVFGYIALVGDQTGPMEYSAVGMRHFIVIGLIWFFYFPFLESVLGYTLAKGIFDLRVVDHKSSGRARFSQCLKRHIFDWVDILFFTLIAVLSVRVGVPRRLGDFIAGTRVDFDRR